MTRRVVFACVLLLASACSAVLGIEDRHVEQDRVTKKDSGAVTGDDDDTTIREGGVVGDTAAPPPTDGGDGASRYRAAVLADAPALYFRFGEAPGVTDLRNEVASSTATYPAAGVQHVPGALAGDTDTAVKFTTSVITVSAGFDFAGTMPCAIELWTKQDTTSTDYAYLLDHQVFGSARHGWGIETRNDFVTYERYTTIGSKSNTATSTKTGLSLGVWHHWVVSFDGAEAQVYVDGEARQRTQGVELPTTDGPWLIGGTDCNNCGGSRFFYNGSLDELAIYTHTLTPTQINAHFAAAK